MDSPHQSLVLLASPSGVAFIAFAIDNSLTPAKSLEKQAWAEEPSKCVYLVRVTLWQYGHETI